MTYRPVRWGVAALATASAVLLDVVIQNQPPDARWIPWIQRFWLPACIVLAVLMVTFELLHSRTQMRSTPAEAPHTNGLTIGRELAVTRSEQAAARSALIHEIRRTWVDGVLARSLDRVDPIKLGLVERPDAVMHPWRTLVRRSGEPDRPLPPGTSLHTIAASEGTQLLVLGEPGAGKTTMLLEYARDLLDEADRQPEACVPVVLHLSFWPSHKPTHPKDAIRLDEWLVSELTVRYGLSERVAREWVARNRLALLLDGLDEVPEDRRAACVETINAFRDAHGQMPLVVCSRTRDYEQIADQASDRAAVQLTMHTALVVQPLTRKQISSWLDAAGDRLTGLQVALTHDEALWDLLSTPLLLNLAILVYADQSANDLTTRGDGVAAKRRQLLADYVKAALTRPRRVLATAGERSYPIKATLHWLTSLARRMHALGESVFYPDQLHTSWLSARERTQVNRRAQWVRWGGGLVAGIVAGLGFGLLGGASAGFLACIGVAWAGIAVGSIVSDYRVGPSDALGWSWISALGSGLPEGLFAGFFTVLVGWALSSVISWLLGGVTIADLVSLSRMESVDPASTELIHRLTMELSTRSSPTLGVVVALASLGWTILRFGLSTRATVAPLAPLLRIQTARRAGLTAGLLTGGIAGLLVGLMNWLLGGLAGGVVNGLIFAQTVAFGVGLGVAVVVYLSVTLVGGILGGVIGDLAAALIVGLHVGLKLGGSTYVRHKLVRRRMRKAGLLPNDLLSFLSFAEERLLIRRAGSGYLFIHQLLLEHFAEGDSANTIDSSSRSKT
jgi:DNA polymerase III delta prime subunit